MEDTATPESVALYRAQQTDIGLEIDFSRRSELFSEAVLSPRRCFIIGVDFGTTFSTISILCIPAGQQNERKTNLAEIWNVCDYPDAPSLGNSSRAEVPTECLYPCGPPPRGLVTHLQMGNDNNGRLQIPVIGDGEDDDLSDDTLGSDNDDTDDEDVLDPMEIDSHLEQYYWGYGVKKAMMHLENVEDTHKQVLRRFKLLLDNSRLTRPIRTGLEVTVGKLQEHNIITSRGKTDIIADFLEHLFRHTRDRMQIKYGYVSGESVEFVLSIPAIWTRKACRVMQTAMTAALHRTRFITAHFHDVDNLVIVHEPEAAAAYALTQCREIKAGESFVLLDAGGGTVDAITYKVASNTPVRLEREAVAPSGDLCGSSFLNEAFEKFLRKRLDGEGYLRHKEMQIEDIMERFETEIKRNFDPGKKNYYECLQISGLRENQKKRFKRNRMFIRLKDMERVFKQCLQRTSRLMLQQIEHAASNGIHVTKVILIGGFAASPALVHHLNRELTEHSIQSGKEIELCQRLSFPGTAVASGAILRALQKDEGPAKTIFSSYGLLRTEPYDKTNPAHIQQIKFKRYDKHDGDPYIKDTISWFVNRNDVLTPGWQYTIPVIHTFDKSEKQLLCEEVLYVSDRNHRSSYRIDHEHNQGMEEAGRIIVDMTELKTKGLIEPRKSYKGGRHYVVEFELVVIVDGRNLRFEARYPCGSTGEECIKQRGRFCIASGYLQDAEEEADEEQEEWV
ncbi:hypothetical protein FE257_009719 [Aspergillus nanangensis]|uniref:Hsp70 family protein n=1 Tax=Aspergillus nanangensis TaxID=2582783 RepID=A0AAD4CJK6_ASPNN|nr:hypothetical protein FE257_009719 [Aspergillus nanangensis]